MRSPSIIHFVIVVVSNTCGDNNEEVFREAIVHLWSLIMHFVVEILISLINKCYSRFYSNDWKIISTSLQVHSTFLHPPVCLRVQLSITYVCNSLQYVFLLVLSEQVTGKKKKTGVNSRMRFWFPSWSGIPCLSELKVSTFGLSFTSILVQISTTTPLRMALVTTIVTSGCCAVLCAFCGMSG